MALITNIGPAHLEGFGDLDGVARAKGEIFSGLADNGSAVINRDEIYADAWLSALQKSQQVIDFALTRPVAAIQAEVLDVTAAEFCLKTAEESIVIHLPLPGRHNIANALAAAAAATALGVPLQNIKQGLQGMHAVAGRLQMLPGPNGSRLINDTYNANPASLAAAFKVLAARPEHSWLVLGDMAELGANASEFHDQAGKQARAENIERIYGIGQYARVTVEAFGEGGSCFKTLESLLQTLRADLQAVSADEAPVILVKGSRSMRMERVIQALSAAL